MEVDRAGMGDVKGARRVDGAHKVPVGVDELAFDRRPRPQTDACGRWFASRPEHRPIAWLELVVEHEVAHRVVERVAEVVVVTVSQRELVRRARDLGPGDERVVGVHDHRFGRPVQQLRRVAGVPLVELVVTGNEHRGRASVGATGAADLLPHRRQRSREAVEHHRVERPDVDAELERAGGDDPAELAVRELRLELASLGGEVAGAVCGHRGRVSVLRERAARVGGDELGPFAAASERQRLVAVGDEARQQHRGLDVGRRSGAGVHVDQRSLPHREPALGLG